MLKIEDIIWEMIGAAWFPINYFKLSLGKQDQLTHFINELQESFSFPISIRKQELILTLKKHSNDPNVKKIYSNLSRYVPYRFLTPWYSENLRSLPDRDKNRLISDLSNKGFSSSQNPVLYRINNGFIEMNPLWKDYMIKHISILEGYSNWHLIKYIERNNPNVPNISEKLFPPGTRNLNNARQYWEIYIDIKKDVKCIYSNIPLKSDNYSIDHFLPWSFVAHDQLWNLIPTTKLVNSAKSNFLPSFCYLEKFIEIQFDAFHITQSKIREKTYEDYIILFKTNKTEITSLSLNKFKEVFVNNMEPLIQIASNLGYQKNWAWPTVKNTILP